MNQPLAPSLNPNPAGDELEAELGALEPRPEDIVAFPDGVPGFESCRRFVLIASDDTAPLSRLQAIDAPRPAFLTIDPALALKRYRKILSPADRVRLDVNDGDTLLWLAIVTLSPDDTASVVNLRAPIVINPRTMIGFQVMPHHSLYPVRHPLSV
jgi:flagellar assembly factor FliW